MAKKTTKKAVTVQDDKLVKSLEDVKDRLEAIGAAAEKASLTRTMKIVKAAAEKIDKVLAGIAEEADRVEARSAKAEAKANREANRKAKAVERVKKMKAELAKAGIDLKDLL